MLSLSQDWTSEGSVLEDTKIEKRARLNPVVGMEETTSQSVVANQANVNTAEIEFACYTGLNYFPTNNNWLFDTGASLHMTGNKDLLYDLRKIKPILVKTAAAKGKLWAKYCGKTTVDLKDRSGNKVRTITVRGLLVAANDFDATLTNMGVSMNTGSEEIVWIPKTDNGLFVMAATIEVFK